jgi:hypothetical protein
MIQQFQDWVYAPKTRVSRRYLHTHGHSGIITMARVWVKAVPVSTDGWMDKQIAIYQNSHTIAYYSVIEGRNSDTRDNMEKH